MQVCLDDFGAGASSLQHLTTFPGQEVKLDCSLIAKIATGTTELAVVKSITDLAHALGLRVTAEGVESVRDWELLEEAGCDRIQGFYCGEPMSPPLLLGYLAGPPRGPERHVRPPPSDQSGRKSSLVPCPISRAVLVICRRPISSLRTEVFAHPPAW